MIWPPARTPGPARPYSRRRLLPERLRALAQQSAPLTAAQQAACAAAHPAPSPTLPNDSAGADDGGRRARRACCACGLRVAHIAPLVALSDVLSMLGSGMTIKFFALFFWKDLGLQPVAVNAVYVAAPVGIAVFAQLAQRASLRLGRIPTVVACKVSGITLLCAMTVATERALVLALYLLRTWLMNCTAGATRGQTRASRPFG